MTETVRQRDDRVMVNVRLRKTGLAVIDRLAETEGTNRSDMIRRLLAEAVTARRAT